MPSVVFLCVANSCRSQMAEALAKSLADPSWEIWSAGSHPAGRVHPVAVQLMAERNLSLETHRSKGVGELPPRSWDYVVTMGCGEACPNLAARHHLSWEIPDPVGLPIEEARRIRDQIERLVRGLLAQAARSPSSA